MTLLGLVAEQTSFLLFLKTGPNTLFGLIARAMRVCRFVVCSGSLQLFKILGGAFY